MRPRTGKRSSSSFLSCVLVMFGFFCVIFIMFTLHAGYPPSNVRREGWSSRGTSLLLDGDPPVKNFSPDTNNAPGTRGSVVSTVNKVVNEQVRRVVQRCILERIAWRTVTVPKPRQGTSDYYSVLLDDAYFSLRGEHRGDVRFCNELYVLDFSSCALGVSLVNETGEYGKGTHVDWVAIVLDIVHPHVLARDVAQYAQDGHFGTALRGHPFLGGHNALGDSFQLSQLLHRCVVGIDLGRNDISYVDHRGGTNDAVQTLLATLWSAEYYPHLTLLFLTGNPLGRIPQVLSSSRITRLSLKSCELTSIDPVAELPKRFIRHVILSNNQLRDCKSSFCGFRKLTKLMLAGNDLDAHNVHRLLSCQGFTQGDSLLESPSTVDVDGTTYADGLGESVEESLELIRIAQNPRLLSGDVVASLEHMSALKYLSIGVLSQHHSLTDLLLLQAPETNLLQRVRCLKSTRDRVTFLGSGASGFGVECELSESIPSATNETVNEPLRVAVKLFKANTSDGDVLSELSIHFSLPSNLNIMRALGWLCFPRSTVLNFFEGNATESERREAELFLSQLLWVRLPLQLMPSQHEADDRCAMGAVFPKATLLAVQPPSIWSITHTNFPGTNPEQPLSCLDALIHSFCIADAVASIHTAMVCHGDLYAHNVFLVKHNSLGEEKFSGKGPLLRLLKAKRQSTPKAILQTATVGDFGASFFFSSESAGLVQSVEVRALGTVLNDLVKLMNGSNAVHLCGAVNVARRLGEIASLALSGKEQLLDGALSPLPLSARIILGQVGNLAWEVLGNLDR